MISVVLYQSNFMHSVKDNTKGKESAKLQAIVYIPFKILYLLGLWQDLKLY